MTGVTPEQIFAYFDGELAGSELLEVEAAIASDPSLTARLGDLAQTTQRLRSAFSPALQEPVPQRFDALLDRHAAPRLHVRSGSLKARDEGVLPGWRRFISPIALSAAAASLIVGIAVGWGIAPSPVGKAIFEIDGAGSIVAVGDLKRSLDVAMAADAIPAHGAMVIRVTFSDGAGRYCREFRLEGASGLACLTRDAWTVEALATSARKPDGSGYSMADGGDAPEVSAARARVGVDKVLDADDEAAAISSQWGRTATQ